MRCKLIFYFVFIVTYFILLNYITSNTFQIEYILSVPSPKFNNKISQHTNIQKSTKKILLNKNKAFSYLKRLKSTHEYSNIFLNKWEVRLKKFLEKKILPELNGILVLNNRDNMAIMNNLLVKRGDMIAGYMVKKITKRYVILQKGNRLYTLYLSEF